jgi:photosystem II stability/assembly factor-like uncharacterized protein
MSEAGNDTTTTAAAVAAMPLRSIGPALMGGRIADLAIHPDHPHRWYLAVGSGGVWRSDDAGISWKPIFDEQPSYSIGCVRIDPSRPNVIWVGTGEAVSGRHVAWGDGVYRSDDGGDTWTHVGLAWSEHVSDILIDPRDGNTIYAAAEGPLWSSGGERGLYKTTDAGASWTRVLHVDDDTGVTSAVFAPNDPETIIAATYQRRRRVWSFLGGGPGSGVHITHDGGESWSHVTAGLPTSDMGRIGLAVTPADPNLVYATIEAADKEQRGFYRSTNGGHSWERRNEYISGGTGPHYYQEIFASPTNPKTVYQVDVFLHVTSDGGATFRQAEDGTAKHSDNHVVWIDPANDDHLIVGCDAGLYETYDACKHFRHVSNLPISQFYRVAVDNAVPFTNVLGGAQDLGTLRGPSRTTHLDGVRNQDWSVVLGADGYHAAFDPDDNDISYISWQGGNVLRHDMRTMELVDIRPLPDRGEPAERWNWDAPLITGTHQPERVYVASQRVWSSDDRGNSWTAISPDLTTNPNRYELAVAERVASVDALYDHMAMSHYGTISALAESTIVDGLIYAGTDDGQIQVTEDGGATWRLAASPPELAEVAFINDLEPSRHEPDTVYLAADDHKSGDYSPHLFVSHDRGRSWTSIATNLPQDTTVWAIEQDSVEERLLFVGAEHGLFVTIDGGASWTRLTTLPTISVRDLAIQTRDRDLVCATFGRGIYVLDDYTPLRDLAAGSLDAVATLFDVRDAWWYIPHQPMQAAGQPTLGTTAFRAPNPDLGATFTFHLGEEVRSLAGERQRDEAELAADGADVPFPGWQRLADEHLDAGPAIVLVVRDADGTAIRQLPAPATAGLHRVTWDLRASAPGPVDLSPAGFRAPWDEPMVGALVTPGLYQVELVGIHGGVAETLAGPSPFNVVAVPGRTSDVDQSTVALFRVEIDGLVRRVAGAAQHTTSLRDRVKHLRAGIAATPDSGDLGVRLEATHRTLEAAAALLLGDPVLQRLDEPDVPSLRATVETIAGAHRQTTGPPTATQRNTAARSETELTAVEATLAEVGEALSALSQDLDDRGGPWTPRS